MHTLEQIHLYNRNFLFKKKYRDENISRLEMVLVSSKHLNPLLPFLTSSPVVDNITHG